MFLFSGIISFSSTVLFTYEASGEDLRAVLPGAFGRLKPRLNGL